jgi:hypothetical protein
VTQAELLRYKLLYFREGGSELHIRDILGILRISGPQIDTGCLTDRADRLGLDALRESVRKGATTER